MMTIDTILFALFYTGIMVPVAFLYYIRGREVGVRQTVHIFNMLEPEALKRMHPKLKEIVDAHAK